MDKMSKRDIYFTIGYSVFIIYTILRMMKVIEFDLGAWAFWITCLFMGYSSEDEI